MVARHRQHSDQHPGRLFPLVDTSYFEKSPNLPKHNFLKIIAQ